MQLRHAESLSTPAEAVARVLGDPEFHMRRIRRDPATVNVRAEPRPGGGHVIHVTQKRRTATGGLDPNQTDPATQELRWESPETLAWTWVQGGKFAITLKGRFRVTTRAGQTLVESETDIDIPIPLVGRVLERVVASEVGKNNTTLRADLLAALG